MNKPKPPKTAPEPPPAAAAARMTTAEATVGALVAHGIDTIYALPGVHNDALFDALFKAGERIRTIHTRHEQGAAYLALGAALATGKPQVYSVVPGPGLLNSSAALLTAYGMNAPVLALVGQIPQSAIGRGVGHLHEIRDQAGIIARLVDFSARIRAPAQAAALVARALRAMRTGRPGPAVLECAIDVWGRSALVSAPAPPLPSAPQEPIDEDALADAAKRLAAAKRPLIVAGGGAQDAAEEVAELSRLLQAPVLAYRRGRGVLDSRDPLSVTLPLGRELWGEADVVLGVGTRLFHGYTHWGLDADLAVIRIDADPEEPERFAPPAVALIGDAKPILRRLIDALPAQHRSARRAEMEERQAKMRRRLAKLAPQIALLEAIRAELPEDGVFVDEVTQIGFAARLLLPVYKPRTFLSPGYQDNLGWGYATALGAQHARADVPVLSIAGDGGFLFTSNELATAIRHRIPLTVVVFNDGAFGNVRRTQEEQFGNRLIASDLANPDFVRYAQSFGAEAERARSPQELRAALKRAFKRRDGPTLIEVPVSQMPSPWEFIHMPRVRGLPEPEGASARIRASVPPCARWEGPC
jgi:acetolactate synthase I/II/III large subunit